MYTTSRWAPYESRASYPAKYPLVTSNVKSVHIKSASITNLVISKKLDILALTETFLSPQDTASCISGISPQTLPHIIPFATNHISLDVEMALGFWYPINLKLSLILYRSILVSKLSALKFRTVHLLVTSYVSIALLEWLHPSLLTFMIY